MRTELDEVVTLLNIHYESYTNVREYAERYGHPHPTDTRAWSQILVSALTGISGLGRKKGADLQDGSDVKGANVWGAIDTPRFNGVIKAGTKSEVSGTMASLDVMPHLFFVLWDTKPVVNTPRCRVWVTNPPTDNAFRAVCEVWYAKHAEGTVSDNFQLQPPRNSDDNVFRNVCGNLEFPLLLEAVREPGGFAITVDDPFAMSEAECSSIVYERKRRQS